MSGATSLGGAHTGGLESLGATGLGAYQSLLEQVPGILYVAEAGLEGRWLYVSPQIEALLGWTPQEWMSDPTLFARSMHEDDRQVEEEAGLPEHTGPQGRHTSEYRLTTRDGRIRWFRDDATLLARQIGHRPAWSGVLTDITEQRKSEHLLRRSDERARAIIDTAVDAYVAFDRQGTICDWNETGERVFGWTHDEIVGLMLGDTLFPERVYAAALESIENATGQGNTAVGQTLELTAFRRDGAEVPVEVTLWRTWEDDEACFSAFLRDITDRKALQAQLTRQAYRDGPTGLANRALFYQRVAQHMATSGSAGFAVLLIALDDFRSVNDSLGHAAADRLLKAVADRLHTAVSGPDTMARLAEDELALLLVDVAAPMHAHHVAEGLQELLRSPTALGGSEGNVRVSIGVRHCASGVEIGVEELVSDAGAAMFAATRGAHGVVVFEDSMRASRLRRLRLTGALEHAVARDEISVHFQPYFSFTDGRPRGVEALARWQHPVHGDVAASEFVLLAESTGQIHKLGRFVLSRACHEFVELRRQHPEHRDLTLSVNVSARQLVDGRLQRELRTVLRQSGLPAEALMLELTETALVEDSHDTAARLADIRQLGVHLAVDDFGTRYASLAYLQRFPIDTLKVDRSFVRRMHQSSEEHRLTGAIIVLAKTLGLRTIAEGIEEPEHAVRLSRLGCDAGQGFLFAHPVPLVELPSALRAGSQRVTEGLPGNTSS